MKMKSSWSAVIFHRIVLVTVLILLAAPSCVKPLDRIEHGKLIPEKTFVSILSDIYIANGLLSLPEIRYEFGGRDSVLNYIDIIKSYGYSYETMNSTMNYYFVSKPKKLIRIYDQIILKMGEMQSGVQNEIMRIEQLASRKAINYNVYELPDPERGKDVGISQIINSSGIYNLTFSIAIFPDDKSLNPCVTGWLVDADSIETGKKKWLPPLEYIKDGHAHQVVYNGRIETHRPMLMKACLYSYENDISEWDKHARIEVFSFLFTSDPL
ncbi:MAG: DUF4296 domain-containing protein [Bacteroidia bacterium]|nr:DUF4296 domain-containing protein [Bacteroidia bacterium]